MNRVPRLTITFPWVELLPESERAEFVADFLAQARGGLSVGRLSGLTETLEAWRDTAAAYADPRIRVDASDLDYLDEAVPVPDPRGASEQTRGSVASVEAGEFELVFEGNRIVLPRTQFDPGSR